MGPASTITAFNAVGEGPNMAHALLVNEVRRDITAKTFRVGMQDKIVTDIKADQQVVMKETGGELPREITGDNVCIERARHREQYEMDALYDRMDEYTLRTKHCWRHCRQSLRRRIWHLRQARGRRYEGCPEENPEYIADRQILRDYRTFHGA